MGKALAVTFKVDLNGSKECLECINSGGVDDNNKIVASYMDSKLAGFLIDEFLDLLGKHLDSLAGDVRTEEAVELIESFKADESAGEHEAVFGLHDPSDRHVIVVEVMKTRIRIDIAHVAEQLFDSGKRYAVGYDLAEHES